MGGAQLATITFLAPTSLAICTISFDVVPLTIESSFLKKRGLVEIDVLAGKYERFTINQQHNLVSKFKSHCIKFFPNILSPVLNIRLYKKKKRNAKYTSFVAQA
jgi:hypothetical protein